MRGRSNKENGKGRRKVRRKGNNGKEGEMTKKGKKEDYEEMRKRKWERKKEGGEEMVR